ncbi:MAG TPA: hypothetical protein VHL53_16480 [Acidimicrobiia bacterium]|nr:hypothetical protein [Acidimicrobiia bacterium]
MSPPTDPFAAARTFLHREGRLVERRLFATVFEGAGPSGVVDAVRAFRNADGGFGHGLEPDKRCPASLPIDVEAAFDALLAAGPAAVAEAGPLISAACDWLGSVAAPAGAVPLSFPVAEAYPRAEHWSEWTYTPGLNPTAGLAGRLHRMGFAHPWLARATEWCFARLEAGFDEDAHSLREVAAFLAAVPDRERAARVGASFGRWLAGAAWYRPDPEDPDYGMTPLDFAPEPDGPWSALFPAGLIEAHLDRLARHQQPDGGWAITWEPPGTAATLEWRGIMTLWALRVLRAYHRL